jgi:hypothetical protein
MDCAAGGHAMAEGEWIFEMSEPPDKMTGMMQRDDEDRRIIVDTVEHFVKEQVILARLERHFSPKPATLAPSDSDGKELERHIDRLVEQLGGPPIVIIRRDDDPKRRYDLFPGAAMSEVIAMFHRTRHSITRAHRSWIGSYFLHEKPEIFSLPTDGNVKAEFLEAVESEFWELAETAYIRLASYWDRVGQLLDFAFFGIRQFERDGFTAVVDRIQNNWVRVDTVLSSLPAWNGLRKFQKSEKEDGLKWLLRRRNLLIHSLYLRPIQEPEYREMFESEFNHIEDKLREKLKPGTPRQELDRMHGQLKMAAELFPSVLELCAHAASVRRLSRRA